MATHPVKPLALTMGDPAGIGPEISIKAWQALHKNAELAFAICAPFGLMKKVAEDAGAPPPQKIDDLSAATDIFIQALPVLDMRNDNLATEKPDKANAPAIIGSIKTAVSLALSGDASAVVTNPISKELLYDAGFNFPGHTEFLADLTKDWEMSGARGPVMVLIGGGLRVGLVTIHLSLKEAVSRISKDVIINKARVMHSALQSDFGISSPRLALTGLNPHAGEGGALGREELDIINPAARELRAAGLDVTDALPADTLFHADARKSYDAVLAMYHDQGLIPVKTLDFHGGVNVTLGLPIIRTSPDHGTAFNIAGKGVARADSLIAAINTAATLSRNRASSRAG